MLHLICLWTFALFGVRFRLSNKHNNYQKNIINPQSYSQLNNLETSKDSSSISTSLTARGDTQNINSNHPVIELVLDRWRNGCKPTKRRFHDKAKIALCIEGGGMRGTTFQNNELNI